MAATHRIKGSTDDFIRPIISALDVAAHVEASLFDVLHSDRTPNEKRAALDALADLAKTLSVTWAHRLPAYGEAGAAVFYRLCGLDRDGGVPEYISRRIEAPEADSGPLASPGGLPEGGA
ncbi:hypothetical protein [Nocardioides maradonensis]